MMKRVSKQTLSKRCAQLRRFIHRWKQSWYPSSKSRYNVEIVASLALKIHLRQRLLEESPRTDSADLARLVAVGRVDDCRPRRHDSQISIWKYSGQQVDGHLLQLVAILNNGSTAALRAKKAPSACPYRETWMYGRSSKCIATFSPWGTASACHRSGCAVVSRYGRTPHPVNAQVSRSPSCARGTSRTRDECARGCFGRFRGGCSGKVDENAQGSHTRTLRRESAVTKVSFPASAMQHCNRSSGPWRAGSVSIVTW